MKEARGQGSWRRGRKGEMKGGKTTGGMRKGVYLLGLGFPLASSRQARGDQTFKESNVWFKEHAKSLVALRAHVLLRVGQNKEVQGEALQRAWKEG